VCDGGPTTIHLARALLWPWFWNKCTQPLQHMQTSLTVPITCRCTQPDHVGWLDPTRLSKSRSGLKVQRYHPCVTPHLFTHVLIITNTHTVDGMCACIQIVSRIVRPDTQLCVTGTLMWPHLAARIRILYAQFPMGRRTHVRCYVRVRVHSLPIRIDALMYFIPPNSFPLSSCPGLCVFVCHGFQALFAVCKSFNYTIFGYLNRIFEPIVNNNLRSGQVVCRMYQSNWCLEQTAFKLIHWPCCQS
jgi:hypothetical protein